uniref:SCP domain-containing protein n=1 Tax=Glossina austeni TaxID=7395 RepID=A0A1A9VV05_GLOAU
MKRTITAQEHWCNWLVTIGIWEMRHISSGILFQSRLSSIGFIEKKTVTHSHMKQIRHTLASFLLKLTNSYGAMCYVNYFQEVAKKGQLIHSAAADYGENIYCCTDCKKFNGSMAAQAWYNEIEFYDFEKSNHLCPSSFGFSSGV